MRLRGALALFPDRDLARPRDGFVEPASARSRDRQRAERQPEPDYRGEERRAQLRLDAGREAQADELAQQDGQRDDRVEGDAAHALVDGQLLAVRTGLVERGAEGD